MNERTDSDGYAVHSVVIAVVVALAAFNFGAQLRHCGPAGPRPSHWTPADVICRPDRQHRGGDQRASGLKTLPGWACP